ncbi:MAG: sigma-70 family RNA polymerase sigma factor [candidate division Zixibacteria bacterium]|nr:sigma-70 family RNA polymerase sigma factor [candidate division Zixibacteria bacterium]
MTARSGDNLATGTRADFDPDAELAAAVAAGDAASFEQLVKKYERPVLSTIYRYVGDRVAAEDVAQEVFLKVWSRINTFKRRSTFSTWLYRIVANECLNFRDRRARRRAEPLSDSLPDGRADLHKRFERETTSRLVREAVNALPGNQRLALILSALEKRPYREVAEIMGVSLSSVESLIFRAKQNLKKKLLPLRECGEV